MGEIEDRDEDPTAEWQSMVDFGESHEEFKEFSEALKAGGPPPSGPSELAKAPLIIDTDIGGDPDDAVALAVAALTVPELALVITSDEYNGQRARFARHFLDLLGRHDVPVVSGSDLGNTRYFCVDGLTPREVPSQPTNVLSAVQSVCSTTAKAKARWVGIGPASNLSSLLSDEPGLVEQLAITQMGGALAYRDPSRAEHNFRLDPDAAIRLLRAVKRPTLVVSDITFNPAIEITIDSTIYRWLADSLNPPAWGRVLQQHMDRWFANFYPGTMQHDPLTLAAALQWPGVRFGRERVLLDDQARMSRSDDGVEIKMSISADYEDFMDWLANRLAQAQNVTSSDAS
ncbi:MAG TPA: nucleoside hydrolase [Kribbella sp.]|jgi:inosine-uridine nucleoside N-ribohydrolase